MKKKSRKTVVYVVCLICFFVIAVCAGLYIGDIRHGDVQENSNHKSMYDYIQGGYLPPQPKCQEPVNPYDASSVEYVGFSGAKATREKCPIDPQGSFSPEYIEGCREFYRQDRKWLECITKEDLSTQEKRVGDPENPTNDQFPPVE